MELIDVPCCEGSFTLFNGGGTTMSRLYKFLLLDNLVSNWKVVGHVVGKSDLSDQCPIWLKANGHDWGQNILCSITAGLNTKVFLNSLNKLRIIVMSHGGTIMS